MSASADDGGMFGAQPAKPVAKPVPARAADGGMFGAAKPPPSAEPPSKPPVSFSVEHDNLSIHFGDNFLGRTLHAIMATEQALMSDPSSWGKGLAKSTTSGAVSMADLSVQGLSGLASHALIEPNRGLLEGMGIKVPADTFEAGQERAKAAVEYARNVTSRITKINLAPQGQEQEAAAQLLNVLPDGINAAGDTVYEKTGSALAGAGTQALLTLLTLKPSVVSETLHGLGSGKPSAAVVETAFDNMAAAEPAKAEAIAKHVEAEDPKLARYIRDRIQKFVDASEKELAKVGEDAAKARLKSLEPPDLKETIKGLKRTAKLEEPPPEPPKGGGKPKVEHHPDELHVTPREFEAIDVAEQVEIRQEAGKPISQKERELLALKGEWDRAGGKGRVKPRMMKLAEELSQKASPTSTPKLSSNFTDRLLHKESQALHEEMFTNQVGRPPTPSEKAALDKRRRELLAQPATPDDLAKLKSALEAKFGPVKVTKLSAEVRNATKEVDDALSAEERAQQRWGVKSPHVDLGGGLYIPKEQLFALFDTAREVVPGVKLAEAKLKTYNEALIRTFLPEALSKDAAIAAAKVTEATTTQKARDAAETYWSNKRRAFWNKNLPKARDFIARVEKGDKFLNDPAMAKAAAAYRQIFDRILRDEQAAGFTYAPVDSYIPHIFKEPEKVSAWLTGKFGTKWGEPGFTKERGFDFYEQAIKAGFEPKFDNPEDIATARIHASNIARMRVEMLHDLADVGMAVPIQVTKTGKRITPRPEGFSEKTYQAPNGTSYYVHDHAQAILHNAFDSKGLWNAENPIVKDAFHAGMWLKNRVTASRLFGAFHAVHVGTIVNSASALARVEKSLLSGQFNPRMWYKDLARGGLPASGLWDRSASRVLKAYWGKPVELSRGEQLLMARMNEAGLVPGMSSIDRVEGMRAFKDAIQRRSLTAPFKLPGATLEALQYPMFHVWIPNMKIAAFARDMAKMYELNPGIDNKPIERQMMLRRIAKSIDDRFGEMNRDAMYWNRTVKDISTFNTLSVGWQYGVVRQFGGGGVELVKALSDPLSIPERARKGQLDRALFSINYVGMAMALTGLMSYAFSGAVASGIDYFYPRTGEINDDGTPKRLNTPFFTREALSVYDHVHQEGWLAGLGHLAKAKASGVVGLVTQAVTGVNDLDQRIRDPNGTTFEKLQQTLKAIFRDVEPISYTSVKRSPDSPTAVKVAKAAGFSDAPGYVTQTDLQAAVKVAYQDQHPNITPYDKAVMSDDVRELRRLYDKDPEGYQNLLDAMEVRYDLTPNEVAKLEKRIAKGPVDPTLHKFSQLDWRTQKKILDENWNKLTEDEQDELLRHANKEHLRNDYEGPKK